MKGASIEKRDYLRSVRSKEIDVPGLPASYRKFVEYVDEHCGNPAHYIRYCQTFLAMVPYLENSSAKVVLETGGFCAISRFLQVQGLECHNSSTDLRYAIDADSGSIDLLLSFEVVEHLKDQTETDFAEVVLFRESGISRYAVEVERVLKPGGLLFLTTPNPCSVRGLELLLDYQVPMIFRPHEREYSRDELIRIFSNLTPLEARTHYSFFNLTKRKQNEWKEIFERNGWNDADRGDDHFLVFRKPAQANPPTPME